MLFETALSSSSIFAQTRHCASVSRANYPIAGVMNLTLMPSDIKSANVLLFGKKKLKITDLGSSKHIGHLSFIPGIKGTPYWMVCVRDRRPCSTVNPISRHQKSLKRNRHKRVGVKQTFGT